MKNHFLHTLLALAAIVLSFSSCTDDDEYASKAPLFSDMTFTNLTADTDEIHVGDRFVATAVRKDAGSLIYKVAYVWSISPSNDDTTQKAATNLDKLYYEGKQNPTDTICINKAGTYTVTLTAKYNASGNVSWWGKQYGSSYTDATFADGATGSSANYTVEGSWYITATLKKRVTILR